MKKPRFLSFGMLLLLAIPTLLLSSFFLVPTQTVTGKSPAVPLATPLSAAQALAQELALTDVRVQDHTFGKKSEVMGVARVSMDFPETSRACGSATCWQVEIYNWNEDAAITAIVNTDAGQVLDVLYQPGMRPGLNQRAAARALEIALNAPEVIETLGYQPVAADMAPVPSGFVKTVCDDGHYCVGPTINMGEKVLWMIVDLTDEEFVGLSFTEFPDQVEPETWIPEGGCPDSATVSQNGWVVNHEVTNHDGFRVYDVTFNNISIIKSSKAVEWHADYGSNGFIDSIGCTGGGGGFSIFPYGDTVNNTLMDGPNVVGFELVQDFRMNNWGANCNYRYEQRYQFFNDGRFRVLAISYGRGCGPNAFYRPIVRIDLALGSQDNHTVSYWDTNSYIPLDTEELFYSPGYCEAPCKYPVLDGHFPLLIEGDGPAYYMEPSTGQFGDGGRGDEPFVYVTQYKDEEGATDLGAIGPCCHDDHRQGPDQYINDEDVSDQNIVIWYVSQADTDTTAGNMYCWTVQGEPEPETYPCYTGPMFVPAIEYTKFLFFPSVGSE